MQELWGRAVNRVALSLVVILGCVPTLFAQPDPRQMSGIPLPDPQLPSGTITVRVIRGSLANNVPDHPVELSQGDNVVTVATDEEGRAEFLTLNAGQTVVASTELDGIRLDSQPFQVPGRGGIRLMLVGAGDSSTASVTAEPAQPGTVTFGAESRVVLELGEETVSVFYLFDIVNLLAAPVELGVPLELRLPAGAVSTTVLRDSHPQTRSEGPVVTLPGPFQPGNTPLRVAYVMPYTGDNVVVEQDLPVDLEALLLIVEKWNAMDIASDQIARRADMNPDGAEGGTYIFAAGPPIRSGSTLSFEITGLPHHSRLPSTVALAVAFVIFCVGTWGSLVPVDASVENERRRRLTDRREKRFTELVRLEKQHQAGKVGMTKYASRRQELLLHLERIYGELDEQNPSVILSSGFQRPETARDTGQSGTTG